MVSSKENPELGPRLNRAVEHVSKMWFPVNPELFSHIKKSAKEGVYDFDVDFLVADIKSDYSLLTYCVREVAQDRKGDTPIDTSPVELLKNAGLEKLKAILGVDSKNISTHGFEGTPPQMTRFREAMLSAATAQTLAPYQDIDPDLGYSAALLRQLGHTLIAWNYPSVYRRALDAQKKGADIELELTNALGFSPVSLTIALFSHWGLSPALVGVSDKQLSESPNGVASRIRKLCSIGEALVRANDPEQYPTALHDWEVARSGIVEYLGSEGLSVIQQALKQNCAHYAQSFPQIFSDIQEVDPERELHNYKKQHVYRTNQYLPQCTPFVQKKLEQLYHTLNTRGIAKENIQQLVRDVIPAAGFTGGCIYVLEPENMTLLPRVRFGALDKPATQALSLRAAQADFDPVTAAFHCTAPIVDNDLSSPGTSYIAASLGEKSKAGVVYLEAPRFTLIEPNNQLLVHFKAIRLTLMDCLGVT